MIDQATQLRVDAIWSCLNHLPPIGWKVDREQKRIVRDPCCFAVMRRVWEMVLEGVPIKKIFHELNYEKGFRTPHHGSVGGSPIARGNLYAMLKNPFYCGKVVYKGETFQGIHEPMVTEEEFERVQELLAKRRRNRTSSPQALG